MSDSQREPLTMDHVRQVAKLARLQLNETELEMYRSQLAVILNYIDKLRELDVTDIEPMAHPLEISNRLDDDAIAQAMPVEKLLRIAPAVEGQYLAVPKVLADEA